MTIIKIISIIFLLLFVCVAPTASTEADSFSSTVTAISILAAIVGLLFACSPSAVTGFVISGIVDALNRVFRSGFSAHIDQKVFVNRPSNTDANASASVLRITGVFRISAALKHESPRVVLGSAWKAISVSPCGSGIKTRLGFSTAATRFSAYDQCPPQSDDVVSAFAAALPFCAAFPRHQFQNSEATECLAS